MNGSISSERGNRMIRLLRRMRIILTFTMLGVMVHGYRGLSRLSSCSAKRIPSRSLSAESTISATAADASSEAYSSYEQQPAKTNDSQQLHLSSTNRSSPWASTIWILRFNFGWNNERCAYYEEPVSSSLLPFAIDNPPSSLYEGSSSSRSRLAVTCPVLITSEDTPKKRIGHSGEDPAIILGRPSFVLKPIINLMNDNDEKENDKHYSYITMEGRQTLTMSAGGWVLEFPPSSSPSHDGGNRGNQKNKGRASKLRFWMDLLTDVKRNDIHLSAGTRLYFMANCWREEEFHAGVAKLRPIQQEAEMAQRRVKEMLSHETGDRRLDGVNALETIQAYGDMAKLVLDKEQKVAKLQQAKWLYPSVENGKNVKFLPRGPWPGSDEWLTLSEERYNPIFIVKEKGLLQGQEYHMVGTWTAEACTGRKVNAD